MAKVKSCQRSLGPMSWRQSESLPPSSQSKFLGWYYNLLKSSRKWNFVKWEKRMCMGKIKLTGQNLGWVFNSRLGHACMFRVIAYITKQPNLKLKTWPKQLLGSLLLAFSSPGLCHLIVRNRFRMDHSIADKLILTYCMPRPS